MKRSQKVWLSLLLILFISVFIAALGIIGTLILFGGIVAMIYFVCAFNDAYDDHNYIMPPKYNIIRKINKLIDK